VSKEISAGIVIYRLTKEGPEFLLLYHGGNYWNFPKGKIEAEEKSLQTAFRETREETGLRASDLRIRKQFRAHEHYTFFSRDRGKIRKTVIFYLAETEKEQIKISGGREKGCGWFLYKDARRMLRVYKDSEAVLKRANEFISQSRFLHRSQSQFQSQRQSF
jgi:8-oxo-dGTP pyrophosphatase MutT (NUDIX family)